MHLLQTIVVALLLSALPALVHSQEDSRARVRVLTPDSTHIGTLMWSTGDSLGIIQTGGRDALERRFARAELVGVERSLGRSAGPATAGGFLGVLAATAFVLAGHPGLPHFGGGDELSAYVLEAMVYSVPAAFLGAGIGRNATPEQWVPEP